MQRWIQRATCAAAGCWLAWTGAAEARSRAQAAESPANEVSSAASSSGGAATQGSATTQGSVTTQDPGASADGGLVTLAQDLTLTVSEDGPNQPWTVTLANRGSAPLGFIADPGLLWFEVTVPGRPAQSCVLPEPLRPAAMQRKSVLILQPGQQYSRRLDPRFFCFAELGQVLLVPGAKVTPHFGWKPEVVAAPTPKKRAVARRAASMAASGPAQPPFVAWRLSATAASDAAPPGPPPDAEEAGAGEDPPARAWTPPREGLKSVQGASLELAPSYSAWAGTAPPPPDSEIELVMLAGADAEDERSATITFGVLNTSDRPQKVFVRRELLSYEVQGPDGFFECPGSDVGSPDFASFSTLPPHGAERAVVRLIEVCPRRSFARPGLYEVHARLNARWSGQELGMDAFVGRLEVSRPAFVRVRSGDRSSFARLVVPPVSGVAPGVVPPGQLDTTPAEPPAEAVPAPEEAPAEPEAPAGEMPAIPEPAPAVPPPVE